MRESTRIRDALIPGVIAAATAGVLVCALRPMAAAATEKSKTARCIANLSRLGVAMQAYVEDYGGAFPLTRRSVTGGTWTWKRSLIPYVKKTDTQKCPSVVNYWARSPQSGSVGDESNALPQYRDNRASWIPVSYAMSAGFFYDSASTGPRKVTDLKDPGQTLLILNSRMAYPDLGPWMMAARCDLNGNDVGASGTSHYGPFVGHQRKITACMADGHAVTEKLIETVQPVDQWRCTAAGYTTQAELLAVAARMADEYK